MTVGKCGRCEKERDIFPVLQVGYTAFLCRPCIDADRATWAKAKRTESAVDRALRVAREVHPDLWKRTEAVARIIDPAAFVDDWIISPPESARLHAAKLAYMRSHAMRQAQTVLEFLGVNTSTDWHEILTRMAKEAA